MLNKVIATYSKAFFNKFIRNNHIKMNSSNEIIVSSKKLRKKEYHTKY
jgi:hypothetical protein